jgi:hypothetical protein
MSFRIRSMKKQHIKSEIKHALLGKAAEGMNENDA